ncbi:MAG: ATP-binding protein [Pseudomonadota bacterium]
MRARLARLSLGTQLTLVLVGTTLLLNAMMVVVDRIDREDRGRQRYRDLAPRAFAIVAPRYFDAPEAHRDTLLRVVSDPARHWTFGARPELRPHDVRDDAYAARVLLWARGRGLAVSEVIIAERPAPVHGRPPGVAMERSPLLSLGEPARTALFERRGDGPPSWVHGRGPGQRDARGAGQERREDRPPPPRDVEARVYTIAMHFGDQPGSWLTLYLLSRPAPINTSVTKSLATVLGALAVAGIGVLIGRRVMRPFHRLAEAADRIGRGERTPALPPAGPRDVQEIVVAFNRMGARVSQSVDYQIGLLQSLGHDLKGPMAAVRGLLKSVGPETTRDQIEERLERVQGIVGSIMAFSRETMRDGEVEITDLAALVEALVEEQAELGREAGYRGPDSLEVRCRFNAVERMLRNVIENAIKYGGSARASLAVDGDEAVVRIEDRGPGIPAEALETVFAPFQRLANDSEGTGLGLAIVRTIAVDHGGSVSLSNRQDGGLSVEIRLPM